MGMLRRRSRLLWLSALGFAVLLVASGWQFFLHDAAEPATVRDAVESFRAEAASPARTASRSGAGKAGTSAPGRLRRAYAAPMPSPGVYVYRTTGFEEIDALGGARHDYPARTTITVSLGGCGLKLRWVALEERETTWERCVTRRGDVLRSELEIHRFFGTTEHTDYLCGTTLERPAGDKPGTTWPLTCKAAGRTKRGTGRVVGRETLTVQGAPVATVHVRWRATLSGKTTGTTGRDVWLARSNGLPVRLTMASETTTGSIVGDVHYRESVELQLTSTTPRR
jgi:hypothetical protein